MRRADPDLPAALSGLLVVVPEGSRVSELEKLRQAPKRTSGAEMVRALQRVGKLVAKAGRVLADQLDLVNQEGADLDVAAMWAAVAEIAGASKEQVCAALEELVPKSDRAAEAASAPRWWRKYNTVRPFLRLLGESKSLSAASRWAAGAGRGTRAAGAVAVTPGRSSRHTGKARKIS